MVPTEELSRAYTSHPRLGYTLLAFVWPNKVQREFKHLNIGYLRYWVYRDELDETRIINSSEDQEKIQGSLSIFTTAAEI